jgi:hypothetical protein
MQALSECVYAGSPYHGALYALAAALEIKAHTGLVSSIEGLVGSIEV